MRHISAILSICLIFNTFAGFGQKIDTLSIRSEALQEQRLVYVYLPEFYRYQSDSVKLPVICILDGQHEWFVNPVLSTLRYLQYTHEIPQSIVVVVPHTNRVKECAIDSVGRELPLHIFLTRELEESLQSYNPGSYRMLIGHSFSASFSLHALLLSPDFYAAVIANSPLDELEKLIVALESVKENSSGKIALSVGGMARDKDFYHRRVYNQLKSGYPSFFSSIGLFEADQSAHNAVPVVAVPQLLMHFFPGFSSRYSHIAAVDSEYRLIEEPGTVDEELERIGKASRLSGLPYPPELPEINGIASRYLSGGYNSHAIGVYESGVKYFPAYYEFHLYLYELLLPDEPGRAKQHLLKAKKLIETIEPDGVEKFTLLKEIGAEISKQGW